MRTFRRLLLSVALCVLATCAGDSDEANVRRITSSSHAMGQSDGSFRNFETVELTLPRGFTIDNIRDAALIDKEGQRFRPTKLGLNRNSDGEETFTGTFEVGKSPLVRLEINEFDIDLRHSRIRRARAPAAAR